MLRYESGTIPYELQMIVDGELNQGEDLVWSGQPRPVRFMLQCLPIVLFGIPWTAFAIFWICGAAGFKIPDFSKGESFFPLFGIPFVLIGLGMLSSPLWAWRKAKKTVYTLTNQRAIIFQKSFSVTIESFGPDKLDDIVKNIRPDGSGDLIFERRISFSRSSKGGNRERIKKIGFFGISEVNHVEDLIAQIKNHAPTE
jgi:hypothetical protein